jgi:thiol:disulfide interchange protein DsbD
MNVRGWRGPGVWALAVVLWLCMGLAQAQLFKSAQPEFLPADEAFQVQVRATGPRALEVDFNLAPDVYLYREQTAARLQWPGQPDQPLNWDLPPGESKHDPTFNKVMEVYHQSIMGGLTLPAGLPAEARLLITYQGCADAGLCYPPQTKAYQLRMDEQGTLLSIQPLGDADPSQAITGASTVGSSGTPAAFGSGDAITRALASGQWWWVVSAFFLAGVLLSLTPCVLPMVPILSSIILGQQAPVGRGRGFLLALSYSQGMALVYTALGVAAGLVGQGLAAYLQHPWVVLTMTALMILLALSMFGLYELRLPVALQTWLGEGANRLPGGRFVSVFVMGAVSALVVSPCVSAPLAGALLYISQSRDVVLGGGALYALAWGMSMPLLLVGLSAGTLLPRAGNWMTAVKVLFGVLMVGVAVWFSRPAWPYVQTQWLGMEVTQSAHRSVLPFQMVRTEAELDAALSQSVAQGRPVMLDFYADWCTACIEMEVRTFADPQVQARLRGAVLLQVDVTRNSRDDRALLKRFGLFGPPGVIFFDPQGQELAELRVIGFANASDFLAVLGRAGL